eukprot:s1403_g4.t1
MVARSLMIGSDALSGGGLCRMVWTLLVGLLMCQHRNSKSQMCTTDMNWDVSPWNGQTGFAGLASSHNLCMVPGGQYRDVFCSAVDQPRTLTYEPKDGFHMPRCQFWCLAGECDDAVMLQEDLRTGWTGETDVASWTSSFPGCMDDICSFHDNIENHSGNLDRAATAVRVDEFSFRQSRCFMAGATPNLFQSGSGKIHFDHSHSNAGKFQLFDFQCNSGYFNLAIKNRQRLRLCPRSSFACARVGAS